MPRFVILEHDHPHLHWDLMLEHGEVLRTWRLALPPEPGGQVTAEALGDHRRAYLDYEGPLSGGRGNVRRWDAGTYTAELEDASRVVVHLDGSRFRGRLILTRSGDGWQAECEG